MTLSSFAANVILVLAVLGFGSGCLIWNVINPPGILFGCLALLSIYWRFWIFPAKGLSSITTISAWSVSCTIGGTMVGIGITILCASLLHLPVHHGLAAVICGICGLIGLMVGLVFGYRHVMKSCSAIATKRAEV